MVDVFVEATRVVINEETIEVFLLIKRILLLWLSHKWNLIKLGDIIRYLEIPFGLQI